MDKIVIEDKDNKVSVNARLLKDKNPKTCKAIWDALPLELELNRWGEELYGTISVNIDAENSQIECDVGDIGYWMSGNGFCIFFGKTPASTSDKPKAASAVNIFAKIEDTDPKIFDQFDQFKGIVKKLD